MKVLVTGAAGFIGFHYIKKLLAEGHQVTGLDSVNDYYDPKLKFARLSQLGISEKDATPFNTLKASQTYGQNFQFTRMHLQDRGQLPLLFDRGNFDVVVNLGAQAGVRHSLDNPNAYVDANVVGFLNILECCRHHTIKHLIFASSSSVYGENKKTPFAVTDAVDHPISLYAATKKSNELMAYSYSHLYNIPVTGLRFFTVYGPWGRPDMAIYLFTKAIDEDRPLQIFNNGEMQRDFTYIDDIVQGMDITFKNPPKPQDGRAPYRLMNLGKGSPQPLMHFIAAIERAMDKSAIKEFLPMQAGDVQQTWADTSELEGLGYRSTFDIEEGIRKFVEWYKGYHG